MKHAVRLLARFVLLSLFLVLTLSSLTVLSRYVIGYDPAQASLPRLVAVSIAALRQNAVISVLVAGAVSLFTIIRSGGRPFFQLVVLGLLWTTLLVVMSGLWLPLPGDPGTPVPTIPEHRFVQVSGTALYAGRVEGLMLGPVLINRPEALPGTEILSEVVFDRENLELIVRGRPDLVFDLAEVSGSYPAMVTVPERVIPLLRDIEALNRILLRTGAADESRGTLLAVVLGAFLLACWTPARLTRWPLFNAAVVFLCIRGSLWLVWSIHFDELGRLLGSIVGSDRSELVSAGVLGFVSIVFLVSLFLMQPLSHWKRELGDE